MLAPTETSESNDDEGEVEINECSSARENEALCEKSIDEIDPKGAKKAAKRE